MWPNHPNPIVINQADTAVLLNSLGIFFCKKIHWIASKLAELAPITNNNIITKTRFGKKGISIMLTPKDIVIIEAKIWALFISFHLNYNIIPKKDPIDIVVCKILNVPISDLSIYLLIDDKRLKNENPNISTIPAKISKFLE